MSGNARLRPSQPPRALLLATGEDVPSGQSLRARMVVVELGIGEVDRAALGEYQRAGQRGLLAAAMGAFLSWWAGRYEEVRRHRAARTQELRNQFRGAAHPRLPGALADLQSAFEIWLQFALESGAISASEREALRDRCIKALGELLALQAPYHLAANPALRFLSLLRTGFAIGRAHLTNRQGGMPPSPAVWGWRAKPSGRWTPQGAKVGWLVGSDLLLNPGISYQIAQQMAGADRLPISEQALRRSLREHGLLASVDAGRGMLQVRRTLEGCPRLVLHLKADSMTGTR